MKIPYSVTVSAEKQTAFHNSIDKFFAEAVLEAETAIRAKEPFKFRRKVLNLTELIPSSTPNPSNSKPSEELAHLLFYRERVIAAVIETRTESNEIHFDYFLNTKYL